MKTPPRLSRSPVPPGFEDSAVSSPAAGYLHDAVFAMEDGFFVIDRQWRYIYANPAGLDLIGKPGNEVLGQCLWEVVPGVRDTEFERQYRRAVQEQKTVRFEAKYEPHGAWYKIHAYPSGQNLAVVARDITHSQRIQSALDESEARHRAIVRAVPDLMLWIRRDGWVLNADMHGSHPLCHASEAIKSEGVVTCLLDAIFAPDVADRIYEAVGRVIDMASADELDLQLGSPDGEISVFEARLVPVDAKAAIMVVRDVTERRRLELEVLRISEDVRQEIGRDLHDGLSSHLTGVAMLARRLARDVRRGLPAAADDIIEVADLIAEGNEQARRLARGLNPVVIERDGLCAALAVLVSSMKSTGGPLCILTSELLSDDGAIGSDHCPPGIPRLDPHAATHLYRIAQEAVHNSVRHADASHVYVGLASRNGELLLSVSDDGRGFDLQLASGMGINMMKYRARLIGGSVEIRSRPEGGTLVTCTMPVPGEPSNPPNRPRP